MTTKAANGAALLVVDVQMGVVATAWERDRVVANVALAVDRARAAGVPVFWVQHEEPEMPRGSADWAWVPELVPRDGEARVYKCHNSSFEGTDLEARLDALGVGRLYLAGASTNWCIRATAYGALERGFDLTLVSDAHTTQDLTPAPDQRVPAASLVADLNAAMAWLSYPGRRNAAVPAAALHFEPA